MSPGDPDQPQHRAPESSVTSYHRLHNTVKVMKSPVRQVTIAVKEEEGGQFDRHFAMILMAAVVGRIGRNDSKDLRSRKRKSVR